MLIRLNKIEQEDKHDLVDLGRIYSSLIQLNIKVFVISPRFNPYKIDECFLESTRKDYSVGPIDVYDKNNDITNDTSHTTKLNDIAHIHVMCLNKIILEKSDPSVRVSIATSGEMILHVVGEVYLEKCLRDLTEDIAPHIEVEVSNPIVPFRETITDSSNCNQNLYRSLKSYFTELENAYYEDHKEDYDIQEASSKKTLKPIVKKDSKRKQDLLAHVEKFNKE